MPYTPNIVIEEQKKGAKKTDWFPVLLPELQTSATRTSGVFNNLYALGMMITIVVENETGTFSVTPSLQTTDAYGDPITWWTASAPIDADGTYQYLVHNSPETNAAFTETVQFAIPRDWKLVLTYSGTPASDMADTKAAARYI